MIIESLSAKAETNIKAAKSFGISEAKIQKLLHIATNNLYANPVLAALVELSQNAYDEHIRQGKGNIPFEVNLPTHWSPIFSVRDFGGGISHEYMLGGYSQILESTKDNDENAAGGWGLGRLALLALGPTYNVTTYIDGKERNYSIYKSEKSIEVVLTGTKDTTEPNGTFVLAPVQPKDINSFAEVAKRAYKYYGTQPTIKGQNIALEKPDYTLKNDKWAFESGDISATAVCGIYNYKIESSEIYGLTEVQKRILGNSGLVLFFGASDLSVQANRQGLYYNDKTVKLIKSRIEDVEKHLQLEIQKLFDNCKSIVEARNTYYEVFHSARNRYGNILGQTPKVTWNNIVIDCYIFKPSNALLADPRLNIQIFSKGYYRGRNKVNRTDGAANFHLNDRRKLFINDLPGGKGALIRARSYVRSSFGVPGQDNICIVVNFADEAIKKHFLKDTHLIEADFNSLAAIPVIKSDRSETGASRAKEKVFLFDGSGCSYGSGASQYWESLEEDFDIKEGQKNVYVEINRFRVEKLNVPHHDNSIAPRYISNILNNLEKIGYKVTELYGVRSTATDILNEIKKSKNWISLQDCLNEALKNYKIHPRFDKIVADARALDRKNTYLVSVGYLNKNFISTVSNMDFKNYFRKLLFLQNQKARLSNFEKNHQVFKYLGGTINTNTDAKPTFDVDALNQEMLKKYPILKYISNPYSYGCYDNRINEIISLLPPKNA